MDISLLSVFIAGLLTFIAPCTLPLIPAFIGYLSGSVDNRQRLFVNTLGFTLGFSAIFILFGLAAGFIGTELLQHRNLLTRIGGVIIIIFGVMLVFEPILKFSGKSTGFKLPVNSQGSFLSSFIIGVSFGLGWSPCLGPILGAVLTLAATSGDLAYSLRLLAIYSAGLALPFFILSTFYEKFSGTISRLRPNFYTNARVIGGIIFVMMGILLLFNNYGFLTEKGTGLLEDVYFETLSDYL